MRKKLLNFIGLIFLILLATQVSGLEGERKVWQEQVENLHYEGESFENETKISPEGVDIPEERAAPQRRPGNNNGSGRSMTFNADLTMDPPGWVVLMGYIALGVIIILLLFLIIKAIDPSAVRRRKVKSNLVSASLEHDIESLQNTDLEVALRNAILEGNYRLAVRLRFLETLKVLEERGIIQWTKSKTNRQYVAEAGSIKAVDDLQMLVLIYEQVWFGNVLANLKIIDEVDKLKANVTGNHE